MALDINNCIADIWYRLGFLNQGELETGTLWLTPTELFNWADEAAKRLAYEAGLFVVADSSVPVMAGNGVCGLPETHVFTLLAGILTVSGGSAGTGAEWGTLPWGTVPWGGNTPFSQGSTFAYALLRLTSVRDLWALDGNWPLTTGNPKRASLDAGSVGTLTLYPIPTVSALLFQICQEYPNISAIATQLSIPSVLQDHFSYYMMAEAREKESEMRQAEMADHFKQRVAMFEELEDYLWGPGQ